jgi:UPF0755 protein
MRKFIFVLFLFFLLVACAGLAAFVIVPEQAQARFGASAAYLTAWQRFTYSASLLWGETLLTVPLQPGAAERPFRIESGEAVTSVVRRLQSEGFIRDAAIFRDYLIYTGLDTTLQAGNYSLSPATPAVQIAYQLQDATPKQVIFTILPGWRMEEIAASLPTSGLRITPEEFLAAARTPRSDFDFLPPNASVEGFMFPGSYPLPREIGATELVTTLVRNFALYLTPDLRLAFARQNLSVYDAVILASIVEREAVLDDEKPLVASVFFNRIAIGMKLETDPTVQYSLGYSPIHGWWKSPLFFSDLTVDSPYNTYLYPGLPPAPISNPDLLSLQAVGYPAQTPYYFFRARCDGSGAHLFAETYAQHLQNACP